MADTSQIPSNANQRPIELGPAARIQQEEIIAAVEADCHEWWRDPARLSQLKCSDTDKDTLRLEEDSFTDEIRTSSTYHDVPSKQRELLSDTAETLEFVMSNEPNYLTLFRLGYAAGTVEALRPEYLLSSFDTQYARSTRSTWFHEWGHHPRTQILSNALQAKAAQDGISFARSLRERWVAQRLADSVLSRPTS
jgi:hypothetical protein